MYTIGEFSKISRVSSKMLRHYDKIDLLKPSFVNPENSYRFYTEDQIEVAFKITILKCYGFSLNEIKVTLDDRSNTILKNLLSNKMKELKDEINFKKNLVVEIENIKERLEQGADFMDYKNDFMIKLVDIKDRYVVSERKTISMDEICNVIGKVFEKIYRNGLNPTDKIITRYFDEDFDDSNTDLEVCIPVNKFMENENVKVETLKGGLHVFTTFIGPYSKIGIAYKALTDWIKENDYEIIAPPFDRYIKGGESTQYPDEFITEVYFPVRKKLK